MTVFKKKKIGIHALYAREPITADKLVFNRTAGPARKTGFRSGLQNMSDVIGATIVFSNFMPVGMLPALFFNSTLRFEFSGAYPELCVVNDLFGKRCFEPHLLDDIVTPASKLIGASIKKASTSVNEEILTVRVHERSSAKEAKFTISALAERFDVIEKLFVVEQRLDSDCVFFNHVHDKYYPHFSVSCSLWKGVKLQDVVNSVKHVDDAHILVFDEKPTKQQVTPRVSKKTRHIKACEVFSKDAMICWSVNGQRIPTNNGASLRLVYGGMSDNRFGSSLCSVNTYCSNLLSSTSSFEDHLRKYSEEREVNKADELVLGNDVSDENNDEFNRAIVTFPCTGSRVKAQTFFEVRGHAWSKSEAVKFVRISYDFGRTWLKACLRKPFDKFAWQRWNIRISLPYKGYYEIWVVAARIEADYREASKNQSEFFGVPLNNIHRVAVFAV